MSEMTVAEALAEMKRNDPARSPAGYMNLLRLAIEALVREQTSSARLLGYIEDAKKTAETWKARAVRAEDLVRKKADAVPSPAQTAERLDADRDFRRAQVGRLEAKLDATQDERDAALRRAEAAEKERDGRVADYERIRVAYESAKTERDVAKNAATVWERHYVEQRDAAQTLRGQLVNGRAMKEEVGQERDALRADCKGLSTLHEQDKAELARFRAAIAEIRQTAPGFKTGSIEGWIKDILDRAEGKSAPLSTPPPYAEEDLRALADTLERERNSALLERDEARKDHTEAESELRAEREERARLEMDAKKSGHEAFEAKGALKRWGCAATELRQMFPAHLNHESNSCVACMVRDLIARTEEPDCVF